MSQIVPTNEMKIGTEARPSEYVVRSPSSPIKRHTCTDIPCLILFVIFLLGQVVLSILIYATGASPIEFLLPHDSSGKTCSSSTPSLFYLDVVSCLNVDALVTSCSSTSVCVSNCPSQNMFYLIYSHRQLMYQTYCQPSGLNAYFANNPPTSVNQTTYYKLATLGICPLYAIASLPVFGRCIPTFLSTSYNQSDLIVALDQNNQSVVITDFTQQLSFGLVAKATQYVFDLMNIKTFAQFVLEDFVNSAVLIIILLLIAAAASFIYIIIIRWILGPLVFLTTLAIVAGLSFCVYYCVIKYQSLRSGSNQNFILTTNFNYYLSLSTTWLVFAIIAGICLLIVLLLILFLVRRVRLAIKLIGEASRAVTAIFTSLFFPILPLALQLGFLAYFVANAVILACAGKNLYRVANTTNSTANKTGLVLIGDSCDPSNGIYIQQGVLCVFYRYGFDYGSVYSTIIEGLSEYQWAPQIYNAFMFFWVETFIIGFNQMVLAGSFGIWYWSQSGSPLTLFSSLKNTIVFHLGSVAFGSLLIAICKLIRTMIQIVERRLKAATANQQQISCLIQFISCCCRCCIWCLEKILKFISRNSYIMTSIWSVSFCRGAREALALLVANPIRALVLDRVTDFVLFLGRLCITAGVGILGFCFFTRAFYIDPQWTKYFSPDLHYYWLPLIVIILGAYFITKTFFTVFEMAVDTIFLCAMKDLDVNDGSPEKPYMMSKRLLKILNVHNMVPKNDNPGDERKF